MPALRGGLGARNGAAGPVQMPEPWAFWILPHPTLSTLIEEGLCGRKVIPHIAQLGILWLPG